MYTPMYEGDGVIRYPKQVSSSEVRTGEQDLAPVKSVEAENHAGTKRVMAVLNTLFRFTGWIDNRLRQARWNQIERYLSRSSDHADLERRLRELERNGQISFS